MTDHQLQPAELTRRKGGPEQGMQAETVVFRGGRVWRRSRTTRPPCLFPQS